MFIELALAATLHNVVSDCRIADDTYKVTVRNVQASIVDPTVVTYDGHGTQPYVVADYNRLVRRGGSFTVTIRFPRDDTFKVLSIDGTPPGNPEGAFSWAPHGITRITVR